MLIILCRTMFLKEIKMSIMIIGMLTLGLGTAEAHNAHHRPHARHHKPAKRVVVVSPQKHSGLSVGWTWVNGHYKARVWISGHWMHPTHGVSHVSRWSHPPLRTHASAEWIPGHWEPRRHRKIWIPGHWSG